MVRKERIERVKREQKRGEESEQSRETQGFALAGRRSHPASEEEIPLVGVVVAGVLLQRALLSGDIFVMHIRE